MTTDDATITTTSPRGLRSKRARAVLAGGLVLGVGAAITLAAWNDSEFVTGIFSVGTFSIEGSTDGATFAEHPTEASAAALTFELDADNIAPEEPVYAGFAVQLTAVSTSAATVDVLASSVSATAAKLSYSLVETATFGCDATAFAAGTPLVTDAATSTSSATDVFELDAAAEPVFLCFEVEPSATLAQSDPAATVVWELAATSTTTLP